MFGASRSREVKSVLLIGKPMKEHSMIESDRPPPLPK